MVKKPKNKKIDPEIKSIYHMQYFKGKFNNVVFLKNSENTH